MAVTHPRGKRGQGLRRYREILQPSCRLRGQVRSLQLVEISLFFLLYGACFAFTASVNQIARFFGGIFSGIVATTFRVLTCVLHSLYSRSKILKQYYDIVTSSSSILYKKEFVKCRYINNRIIEFT